MEKIPDYSRMRPHDIVSGTSGFLTKENSLEIKEEKYKNLLKQTIETSQTISICENKETRINMSDLKLKTVKNPERQDDRKIASLNIGYNKQ